MSRHLHRHSHGPQEDLRFDLVPATELEHEPGSDGVPAALSDLFDTLNGLPDPLSSVVDELAPNDIATLMRPMPPGVRGSTLNHLGMGRLSPQKKIPQALCQSILVRMQSTTYHDRWHAAWMLTTPMRQLLWGAVTLAEVGPPPEDPLLDEKVEKFLTRTPDRHLRLALWSELRASVDDARLVRWAAQQPWWLPASLAEEHGRQLADVAQSVIDASPSATLTAEPSARDAARDSDGHGTDVLGSGMREAAPSADSSNEDADIGVGRQTPRGGADAVNDNPAVTDGEHSTAAIRDEHRTDLDRPDGSEPDSLGDAGAAVDVWAAQGRASALAAHAAAAQALSRITAAVDVFAVPVQDDLAAVGAYADAAGALFARLADQPGAGAVGDLPTFDAELERLAQDAQSRQAARLLRLRPVGTNPQLDAAVSGVNQLAGQSDSPRDALLALADLVDLVAADGAAADYTTVMALQQAMVPLGADLQVLSMAAVMGQLYFADTEEVAERERVADLQQADEPTAQEYDAAGPEDAGGDGNALTTEPEQADAGEMEEYAALAIASADEHAGAAPSDRPEAPVTVPPNDAQNIAGDVPTAPDTSQGHSAPAAASAPNTDIAGQDSRPASTAPPTVADALDAADVTPASEDDEPAVSDAEISSALADLIGSGRLALAAEIAEKAGRSPNRVAALQLAALAAQVRTNASPAVARVQEILAQADDLGSEEVALTVAVPALLRIALVTGDHSCGALLANLAARLDPDLAAIAQQVGDRALRGALFGNTLNSAVADLSDLDADIAAASAAAAAALDRPRTIRGFKRATDIATAWMSPDGEFGTLLTAAAQDDRGRAAFAAEQLRHLSGHAKATRMVEDADRALRGSNSNRLEGAAKQDLISLAATACDIVSTWLEAVAVRESVQLSDPRTSAEVSTMRHTLRAHTASALAELEVKAASGRPVAAAAARHAHGQLQGVFALLEGPTRPAVEVAPEAVLTAEVLKLPGAVADPATGVVTAAGPTGLHELIAAARTSWADAFTDKVEREEYAAARVILDRAAAGTLPGDTSLPPDGPARLEQAVTRSRTELEDHAEQIEAQVRQAQMNGLLSAEQDLELDGVLRQVNLKGDALGAARAALEQVAGMLPEFRAAAADRLTTRLESLSRGGNEHPDAERIAALIDHGELSTAEELIYALETGEEIPEQQTGRDLPEFFPTVPAALPYGITQELISTVQAGRSMPDCQALDYSALPEEARSVVATTLTRWRVAAQLNTDGRRLQDHAAWLAPVLRLVGYDAPVQRVKPGERAAEWRMFEVSDVRTTGKAMLPDFGSRLNGRLRVLVCWEKPDPNLLMSWVDQDAAAQSVLVVYFGTMNAEARQRLAVRVLSSSAPVAVLDDAALVYLAAHGNRQLADAMAVLAPFSASRPYAREKRALVPPELFYGRDSERRDVMSMTGPQIVYGGRGLGKSALLRDAKARFEQGGVRKGVYLDVKTIGIGPNRQPAAALWPVLWQGLRDAGIAPPPRPKSADRAPGHQEVRTCIRDWLLEDPARQLLILLDESDDFFEADTPHFTQTSRLKELGMLPGVEGRAKAVFAGLHSVARFAAVSNQVFKHLAQQPIVIGPLPPRYAYNLLTRPLATLGYEFERDDLVFRICGYCSYQPFLLQMFATRLLEQMHAKREADGLSAAEPPYVIQSVDVDAVEARADLKVDIVTTFAETLNLDPRYYVIANVLAHHAHQQTLEARLPERELRNDCLSWWPEGFRMLDVERFRTYLTEMVGLGVLAQNTDGRGWHLRSPNTLRMMGTAEQVENNLLNAREKQVEPDILALNARRELAAGGTAPLTAEQVADVLGDRGNQVRVVLGTDATALGGVNTLLTEVTQDLAEHYNLVQVTDRKQFHGALTDGVPGQRRGVLSNLAVAGTKCDGCAEALAAALTLTPAALGVSRSVVLVAGPGQLPFWKHVLAGGEADGQVVSLRRLDAKALKAWTLETGRPFTSDTLQDRLLEVTGGWPMLLDRARQLFDRGEEASEALETLARQLADPQGAAAFLRQAGLVEDVDLIAALDAVIRYTEGAAMPPADLVDVIADSPGPDGTDPHVALACLEALGVFDQVSDGWRVDPLVVACWQHRSRALGA